MPRWPAWLKRWPGHGWPATCSTRGSNGPWVADALQRFYTDDGHGDGRVSRDGIAKLPYFCAVCGQHDFNMDAMLASVRAAPFAVGSRTTVMAAYDDWLNRAAANFALPRRLADWRSVDGDRERWLHGPVDRVWMAALAPFLAPLSN